MPTDTTVLLSVGLSAVLLAGCGSTSDGDQPASSAPASAQQMVHLLETLLPRGAFSAQQGTGLTAIGPAPSAQLVFERGGNAAMVRAILNRYPAPVPAQLLSCPDTAYHPYSACTQTQLPGGATLVLDRSPEDDDRPSGGKVLTALLTYHDRTQVAVSAAAGPGSGNTSLPLTLEQLSAIATSAVWRPVLRAMPEPRAVARTGSVPRMTGPEISHIIEALLPPGLHATRAGGSEGFGHVTVDDGRGESLVAANVQRWRTDHPSMTQLFREADTLIDGTRIRIQAAPPLRGGAGAVEWSVDTLRKDGLRVVISAVNAGAYRLPASRGEPALTIAQLQRIALDGAWRRAGDVSRTD